MWVLFPNFLGFLVVIWSGTTVMVSTFFLVVWLLTFTPGHKALAEQWFTFIGLQAAVHWAASAILLVGAVLWNVVEWWVAPKVSMHWRKMMDRLQRYRYESVD